MKKLVCIGGGNVPRYMNGILMKHETKEIDEEIVRLTNKTNPKFLFISIASYHPEEYFEGINKVYTSLGCTITHLDINKPYKEIENEILNTDIIYVGAGDTKLLLDRLKETNLDKLLIKAYNKGIVCAGISAGSYCFFKYNYKLLEGINIINAINIAHYDEKKEEDKNKFYNVIKETKLVGYAIDNYVAIEFLDNNIKVIKSNTNYNAYKITYINNEFIEEKL